MASLLAGLPVEVPGVTVNRLCASGLEAVNQASRALRLGEGDLYLAGGAESMSRAPWVVPKPEAGLPRGPQTMHDTALGWRLINPRMAELYSTESMGETGENVAERYGVHPRGAGPLRASKPHAGRCRDATRAGSPTRSISVEAPPPRRAAANRSLVEVDEGPRADTSLEKLAKLRPAFREGGTVTAGNASTLNDGAACLVMASAERAEAMGAEPLARIVSIGVAGVDPAYMGIGPDPGDPPGRSTRRACRSTRSIWSRSTRPSPPRSSPCIGELGIEEERLNVNGGAIALGHPLGCSGARLMTTLVWEMRRRRRPVRHRRAVRRRRPGRGDRGREPRRRREPRAG